jgi:hypothetical protein
LGHHTDKGKEPWESQEKASLGQKPAYLVATTLYYTSNIQLVLSDAAADNTL